MGTDSVRSHLAIKPKALREIFSRILSPNAILDSPEDRKAYATDWTRTPGDCALVLLPGNTAEVSAILKLASENQIAIVPSGGRTGLAGGAVAQAGQVVLSLSRLNQIGAVDTLGRTVRVQAGVNTQTVHEHCEPFGLTWPIDLAAKGSSQIGGNLSTNAGGLRVIRYGMARKWVSAIQAVLMNGDVIELNQDLEKNNTGYDLLQMLIGSEGTLAVITEATLKLAPVPKNATVFFFALEKVENLEPLFNFARKGPFVITAFEFFSEACRKVVEAKLSRKSRLQQGGSYYAVMEVETENHAGARQAVDQWLEELIGSGVALDGLLADSAESQKAVWGLREGITESLAMSGSVRKYDVCVPVRRGVDFLKAAQALYDQMKLNSTLFLFGHFGDGSPHLNFLKPLAMSPEEFHAEIDSFERELYPLLKSFHGSVSSEHGIGCLKKNWVQFSRTPSELALYRAIKHAFDPKGLLNPGKIIE